MRNTYNVTPEPVYIVRQSLRVLSPTADRGGQTARERTESIGVRPSSEAGLQNRLYLYQLWPITL